jgi:hypothetical protein
MNKPIRVMELWKHGGTILGTEITWIRPSDAVRGFAISYDLDGKAAHYLAVSHDSSISRDAAITFCAAHAAGAFRLIQVNLEGVYIDRADSDHRLKLKE